jgi:hypothetical protein
MTATLSRAASGSRPDAHVDPVGVVADGRRRLVMPAIYWPLVDALVPTFGRQCDPTPLSGLHVTDTEVPIGPLPDGYGVETHLNLTFAAAGAKIAITDVGPLCVPLRGYANIAEMAHRRSPARSSTSRWTSDTSTGSCDRAGTTGPLR